jgi:hypothetical protein
MRWPEWDDLTELTPKQNKIKTETQNRFNISKNIKTKKTLNKNRSNT